MASSRLEKIGTIFSRIEGLMKTGALKHVDRPIWFDVYAAFPPKFEPRFDRKPEKTGYRRLLFKEDLIRARFYKTFGSPGTIDMTDDKPAASQLFLEKYMELERLLPNQSEDEIFETTVTELEKSGTLSLRPSVKQGAQPHTTPLSNVPSDSKEQSLASMFQDAVDSR